MQYLHRSQLIYLFKYCIFSIYNILYICIYSSGKIYFFLTLFIKIFFFFDLMSSSPPVVIRIWRTATSAGGPHTLHLLSSSCRHSSHFDSHTYRYGAVPRWVQLRLCSVLCGDAQRTTVARKRPVWRGHLPLPSSDLFFSPLTTFSALFLSALCGRGSRNTCICSAVSAVWEEEFRFQYNFILKVHPCGW